MIRRKSSLALVLALLSAGGDCVGKVWAQRHSDGMSPPTAPPRVQPILPVSTGLGPIQFQQVDYGVPAPQALSRQLQSDDDRTRAAALSAIGAPGQYLQRGHIPTVRALQLEFAPMSQGDDQDAILTAELDQHIVSAILVPSDGLWRRVGTVIFPTAAADANMQPSTFLRVTRSVLQRGRYRAIFTAATTTPAGDSSENQAYLRIINNHAVITMSFVSELRVCDTGHGKGHGGCDLTLRWVQPDTSEPGLHTLLVSGTGRLAPAEATNPMSHAREFEMAHLRNFLCQTFVFDDTTQRYEPTSQPAPCSIPH